MIAREIPPIARERDTSHARVDHATGGRLVLVLLVAYVCFFNGLTSFGLVGPDEPRYASIARDMAASGDWVTPRLHGDPWLEKPILYYWIAAAGFKIFGDGELAARLPSVLGAVTTMLAVGWVAWRFYGPTTAVFFALLFPSSIAVLAFARAATPDMLFTSTLALALAAAAPLMLSSQVRAVALHQAAFGAALGLGMLAKGPAAIVLAGAGVALGGLLTKRSTRVLRLAGPWALASFGAVALPWYILCSLRNPEFIQIFFVSHNVERFLTPVFQHQQPFWYFAPVLLLGLAPWTAAIVATMQEAAITLRRREWSGSPSIFFASWVLVPVVFFSLSQSKLPGYVLPAVPAAAMLLAHALAVTLQRSRARARRLGLGMAAAIGAMTMVFIIAPGVASAGVEAGAVRPLALVLGVSACVAAYVGHRGQLYTAVAVSALGVALTLWQLNAVLLPRLDPLISTRAVARDAADMSHGGPVHAYELHRAWRYGLEYYLDRPVPEWSNQTPGGTIVITTDRGLRAMQLDGTSVQLVRRVSDDAVLVQTDRADDRLARRQDVTSARSP